MNTHPFRDLDECGECRVYHHGRLPHWRQTDCTYFVTFRQVDALPIGVVRQFVYERNLWLSSRGIVATKLLDGKITWSDTVGKLSKADQQLHERTMATKLNKYLDAGHGTCVLEKPQSRWRKKATRQYAWWLVSINNERQCLSSIVGMQLTF